MPLLFVGGGRVFAPSGATIPAGQSWASNATYVAVTGATANTGTYPGSTMNGNRLLVQGPKTGATITASVPYSGGTFGVQHTIRAVDQNGTQIGSVSSAQTGSSGTCTLNLTGVDLTAITEVGIEMAATSSASGSISTGGSFTIT